MKSSLKSLKTRKRRFASRGFLRSSDPEKSSRGYLDDSFDRYLSDFFFGLLRSIEFIDIKNPLKTRKDGFYPRELPASGDPEKCRPGYLLRTDLIDKILINSEKEDRKKTGEKIGKEDVIYVLALYSTINGIVKQLEMNKEEKDFFSPSND